MFALEGDDVELSLLDGVTRFTVDGAEVDSARVPHRSCASGRKQG
jgi:hypothetical protein